MIFPAGSHADSSAKNDNAHCRTFLPSHRQTGVRFAPVNRT